MYTPRMYTDFQCDCIDGFESFLPCRTKTWFTSSNMSQPSTIIRSTAKFFRKFSVSETSSCICRDKSSSCWRAFCKLFRSTWSCGVCANNSCKVIIYLGICLPTERRRKKLLMFSVRMTVDENALFNVHTWCIGYVRNISKLLPWHIGFASKRLSTVANAWWLLHSVNTCKL